MDKTIVTGEINDFPFEIIFTALLVPFALSYLRLLYKEMKMYLKGRPSINALTGIIPKYILMLTLIVIAVLFLWW